jgi:hypothetical protein
MEDEGCQETPAPETTSEWARRYGDPTDVARQRV